MGDEEYTYKELSNFDKVQVLRNAIREAEASLYRTNLDLMLDTDVQEMQRLRAMKARIIEAINTYTGELNSLSG